MAEYGTFISGMTTGGVTYDLLDHREARQSYNGQIPTYSSSLSIALTQDLARFGLNEKSQLTAVFLNTYNSFHGSGPNSTIVNRLSVYLPFFDERVIAQAGIYQIANMFYGRIIGPNSAAGALGPQSSLLFQTGAQGFRPTSAADLRLYSLDRRLYTHLGVFRSISANGALFDAEENSSGLELSVPNGKIAFIDEIGYRVEAAPNHKRIWLRAGAIYNTSDYAVWGNPGETANNLGFYALADFQLTQSDLARPHLGWYINARYNAAREEVNAYSSDVSLTLYKIGTFEQRSKDLFSVGVLRNNVSEPFRRSLVNAGLEPVKAATSYSASYTMNLRRGLYLQTGLTYTDNPTIVPSRPGALNLQATLSASL